MTEESERTWCLTCSFLGFYLFLKKHHIKLGLVAKLSYSDITDLEVGLLCPWGAGLLAQVGTGSAPQRCWRLLLRRQPSLDPAASSPAQTQETVITERAQTHTHTETSWHHHIYLLRWSAHTSDRPRKASWCLRHRSTSGNAATCCPPHAWPSCHACQWDTSDPRL